MNELKNEFIKIATNNIQRDGIKDLLGWLEYTDFYTAPASTKFHGAEPEGLLKHSLNVYYHIRTLYSTYYFNNLISLTPLTIVSLFHDLCKIDCYEEETRWKKIDNKWEAYTAYKFNDKLPLGAHAAKSLYLLQTFMKITVQEASAILTHMGAYEATNYSNTSKVYETNLLAWLLHVADEADTFGILPFKGEENV